MADETKIIGDEQPTVLFDNEDKASIKPIGAITANGVEYRLKPGRNVIGREASSSKADIQIPCTNKIMSREHIVIDAQLQPHKGYIHTLSLYKEVKNATFYAGKQMKFGDSHTLSDGDKILLPGTEVTFIIPDEDKTVIR